MTAGRRVRVLSPRVLQPMAERLANCTEAQAEAIAAPRVIMVPYVAEQSGRDDARSSAQQHAPLALKEISTRVRSALANGGGKGELLKVGEYPDSHYWGSSMAHFLRHVAPHLASFAVVVSHGNFLQKEVCGKDVCSSPIPNGGALLVTLGTQKLLFVRHCLTCHNIDKAGSAGLTVCHDFEELRPVAFLVRALATALGGEQEFGIYSSPMPRAILTAFALQRPVWEAERLAFCRVFSACPRSIQPAKVRAHRAKWSCERSLLAGSPFCGGRLDLDLDLDPQEDG